MTMERNFKFSSEFDCNQSYLFDWHEQGGAFERLVPPWKSVRMIHSDDRISNGAKTVFSIGLGLIRVKWEAIHKGYEYPDQFIDVQKNWALQILGASPPFLGQPRRECPDG